MKANAPEKLYVDINDNLSDSILYGFTKKRTDDDIEYTRTDTFVEKALKWYCLDCECNDNCKDIKCFFYREYERYLKGKTNAIPPKISDRIINEDGSVTENYRYRHFINRMQDTFIEKACSWLENNLQGIVGGSIYIEDFRKYMEGE